MSDCPGRQPAPCCGAVAWDRSFPGGHPASINSQENLPMADPMNGKTGPQTAVPDEESFREQLSMMRSAFMASPLRGTLFALAGGMLAIILATAFGQVLLNRWNQPFYDALSRRDLPAFMHQLVVFAEIAGGLLLVNVMQTWISQTLHLRLREGLTRDLIGEWM